MIKATQETINEVLALKLKAKEDIKQSFLRKRRTSDLNIDEYSSRRKSTLTNILEIQMTPNGSSKFEDLICPICLEVFQKVSITQCGHTFCEMCIFDSLIRKPECPVCRVKLTTHNFQYCESFDTRINQIISQQGDEKQREHFKKRQIEKDEWNEQKSLGTLTVGQKVDIMDYHFIWCTGTIKSINEKEIFIHYDGWGNEYDEFIPLTSHRIAPHGLYTNRTDIPKYQEQRPTTQLLQLIQQFDIQILAQTSSEQQ